MSEIALVFALMAGVAALAAVAGRIGIPYPILLVIAGLALAFVPGLPRVVLAPEFVFLLFLPPLLFSGGYAASWRDLRENARDISLLAVGLILVTTVAVAVVAHAVAGLSWVAAFVLGAVVSPTDAIAATAIAKRLGVPNRIVTVLEGESLVNDATGIVAYRIAVQVAMGVVVFSPVAASIQFIVGAVGGILLGLLVGWLTASISRVIDDAPVEAVASLVAPFLAYALSEEAPRFVWHSLFGFPGEPYFSGVLAVVAAGLYVGRSVPLVMSSTSRLKLDAIWSLVTFLLNGLAFILIGLQLPAIADGLGKYTPAELALSAVLVSLAVFLVRALWVMLTSYVPHVLYRGSREQNPHAPWPHVVVISWAGMRGVVSLAAALALPLTTPSGGPFPERDLILFLTFSVILATLVIQGLSLPLVIRKLGLTDDGLAQREELAARIEAAEAALTRLRELETESSVHKDTVETARKLYGDRRARLLARSRPRDGNRKDIQAIEARSRDAQRLMAELVQAQRTALIRLRDNDDYYR